MIDDRLAAELDRLAEAIARLRPPQNHNPHAFHEDRSELASRARSIAEQFRVGPALKHQVEERPAPIGRQSEYRTVRHIEGRASVMVVTRRVTAGAGRS